MENIFEFGKVPYEQAPPPKMVTFSENILFVLRVMLDVLRVVFMSVPALLESFVYLFLHLSKKKVFGQTVLITGAGNGLGRAMALQLAKEGCNVAVADIDIEAAKKTALDVRNLNVHSKAYYIDVGNYEMVNQLRQNIENDLGAVDILINNAGIIPKISIREGTNEEIDRIVQINITSHYYMVRAFLPTMMKRCRGHIVGISSMSALHPLPGCVIYTSTKCAVLGFVQALSEELRLEGYGDTIRFTAILPYFLSTRKDLIELMHLRFPAITVEQAAAEAVAAILQNKEIVSIPRYNMSCTTVLNLLPFKIQRLIREYILKERGMKGHVLQK